MGKKRTHRIHETGIFTYIYHETQAFMLYANVPGNSANQRDLFGMVEFKTWPKLKGCWNGDLQGSGMKLGHEWNGTWYGYLEDQFHLGYVVSN